MTTHLTDAQTDHMKTLRLTQGLGITVLAAMFKVGVERVKEIIGTLGLSGQSMNARVAKCVCRNPEWTDEQVAEHCQCLPALVAHRRPQIKLNRQQRELSEGIALSESADRGPKFRVSRHWLRTHCSRGERDIPQIQTMCTVAGLKLTLAEVRASCEAAGLTVPRIGRVHDPTKRRLEVGESRPLKHKKKGGAK